MTRAGEVASYVSDGEGAFRFDGVAPGTYSVSYTHLTLPTSDLV